MIFLHGILGTGRNWKTPAKRIVASHPHWQALLVDHRGHGASEEGGEPHDLESCAEDLNQLLHGLSLRPDVVCGHSFGGKVALAFKKASLEKGEGGGMRARGRRSVQLVMTGSRARFWRRVGNASQDVGV